MNTIHSPIKSDLVIGMTLAEIFLLILFVVWYRQGAGQGGDWKKIAEERQAQIEQLKDRLEKGNSEIAELEKIRSFWQSNFKVAPPTSQAELSAALISPEAQKMRQDMARGFPRCEENNLIVDISVQRGATELRIKEPARILQRGVGDGISNPGEVLTDSQMIEAFLQSVSRFYENRTPNCRFDYKLTYATKEDYYDGRERFEKYFYAAALKAVQPLKQ